MRIVAGSARGRRLVGPQGQSTRPTSDRVREAMFNALYSLGAIDDMVYCDLFAGSGALGLEALSRGARHVIFVERDRAALTALRQNLQTLDFEDRATVASSDSMLWLGARGASPDPTDPIDVVLADPPYEFASWSELLDLSALAAAELVVAESNVAIEATSGWESLRARSYGTTVVTILGATNPRPSGHTREPIA